MKKFNIILSAVAFALITLPASQVFGMPRPHSLAKSFCQKFNVDLTTAIPETAIILCQKNVHMRVCPNKVIVVQLPSKQQGTTVECGAYATCNIDPMSHNDIDSVLTFLDNHLSKEKDKHWQTIANALLKLREEQTTSHHEKLDMFDQTEIAQMLRDNHIMITPEDDGNYSSDDDDFSELENTHMSRGHLREKNIMLSVVDLSNSQTEQGISKNILTQLELKEAATEFSNNEIHSELFLVVHKVHWMAVRVETLPNGWTFVFFSNSMGRNRGQSIVSFKSLWKHLSLCGHKNVTIHNENFVENFYANEEEDDDNFDLEEDEKEHTIISLENYSQKCNPRTSSDESLSAMEIENDDPFFSSEESDSDDDFDFGDSKEEEENMENDFSEIEGELSEEDRMQIAINNSLNNQ